MAQKQFERKEYRKIINRIYQNNLSRFFRRLDYVIGIAGGFALVYLFFEVFSKLPQKIIFLTSVIVYLVSLAVALFTDFIIITIKIYKQPERLIGDFIKNRDVISDLVGGLYGVQKSLTKEICHIHVDGSFDSQIEERITATAENITAIELTEEYIGPSLGNIGISDKSIRVFPDDYSNVSLTKIKDKQGYYKLKFPKELPINKDVIITYPACGKGEVFAIRPEHYPGGVQFEYSTRTILYPTREFVMEIIFEDDYPVSIVTDRPKPIAWYGNAKVEHENEIKRMHENFKFFNRKAVLYVKNPIHGLKYGIKWAIET